MRFKVSAKKACEDVVLEKDILIEEPTEIVDIYLEGKDTKIGSVISKPVDYWYEVELNPNTDPQTIIGYDDENGAKIFKLFPESGDFTADDPSEADLPFVDDELSETSEHPIQNRVVTAALLMLEKCLNKLEADVSENEVGIDGASKHWTIGGEDTGILARATHVHFKWAARMPTSNADMLDYPADYIGVYWGDSENPPSDYTVYQWIKYVGESPSVTELEAYTAQLVSAHNESKNPHPGKFAPAEHGHEGVYAPKVHGHAASEVTAGTLGGAVKANMAATADISVSQVRDIMFGTEEITAGSASTEPEGSLHFVIE